MKTVLLSLVLALAVSAADATSASASSSTRAGSETAASFCGVARGVARDIVNSTSLSHAAALTPADLKTAYGKVAAAEPALLSSSPKTLKSNLRQVFGFVNLLIADYKKTNWNVRGLLADPTLVPRAKAVQRPMHAVKIYLNGTCKLNV
jgi:hypothetical protein